MKKINEAIKMLTISVMSTASFFQPVFCQEPTVDNDLITYSMSVSSGQKVNFRLPLDMRSGDRITGTVIEEKKNNFVKTRTASSTLEGIVIEIEGKHTRLTDRIFSFIVPAGITSLPFILKNSKGDVIEQSQIKVRGTSKGDNNVFIDIVNLGRFVPEKIGQPGKSFRITGNFDGDASNTKVSLNGQACEIIAESPRKSFIQVPENIMPGICPITVEEFGIGDASKVNIAVLNLSSNKTTLRKGQKAVITVTVSGLDSLKESYECIVDITNRSPEIVSFNNNTGNHIRLTIPPGQNGDYTHTFQIVGVTRGNFTLEGLLFCRPNPLKSPSDFGDDVFVEFNDNVLFDILRDLNKAKDYDYSANGGKPGRDAAWLWERIQIVMKQLSNLGWEPDPHDANYLVNKHTGERRAVR